MIEEKVGLMLSKNFGVLGRGEEIKVFKIVVREPLEIIPLVYNLDTKILIYEDRITGWFFDIADELRSNNETGYVILMIATAYLESNQKCIEGYCKDDWKESTNRLRRAIRRLFVDIPEIAVDFLVTDLRNGLFHDFIAKGNTSIQNTLPHVFFGDKNGIVINPHLFLDAVKIDFENYILKLKDVNNAQDRKNFEKYWDYLCG